LLLLATVVAADRCTDYQICHFGTETNYVYFSTWLFDTMGCCGPNAGCVCPTRAQLLSPFANDCQNISCGSVEARHIMAYRPFFDCDDRFRTAQNALLSVCGTIGGECCQDNCTQDNVDRPILPNCQRRPQMEHWHRWLLTVYVAITIGSTQLVLDREAWSYRAVDNEGFFM